MTILTQDYLRNELDYTPNAVNQEILFKDYYRKICGYVRKHNWYKLSPNEIEEWLESGTTCRVAPVKSRINTKAERVDWFMRAMGLQLIYDSVNGRNEMIKGTNTEYDLCRDSANCLSEIGLIHEGW